MHTLYWSKGTASLAPHIVLEDATLPYELVEVPTASGAHRTAEYLAINPAGKVPALRLPNTEVMTETAAICLYLADSHRIETLSPAFDDPARGQFLRHLFYLTNTIQEAYRRYYYPHRFSTESTAVDGIKACAKSELLAMWQQVDEHLSANGPFYLGNRFGLLDIYLTMLVTWFDPMATLLDACPSVRRCYELTSARPAVAHCLAMQGDELSIGTD